MVTEEYSYARARARLPLKVNVPSPLVLYGFWSPKYSTGAYSDAFAMVEGVSGVRLGIHLCRGNDAGMWMASGGYEYIAQALFERATAFDAFCLEYDDARSGSFEPLAGAPDDKQVVLGLVSTKTPALETPDELRGRIDEAARFFVLCRRPHRTNYADAVTMPTRWSGCPRGTGVGGLLKRASGRSVGIVIRGCRGRRARRRWACSGRARRWRA
jgi:hypothetical protein